MDYYNPYNLVCWFRPLEIGLMALRRQAMGWWQAVCLVGWGKGKCRAYLRNGLFRFFVRFPATTGWATVWIGCFATGVPPTRLWVGAQPV